MTNSVKNYFRNQTLLSNVINSLAELKVRKEMLVEELFKVNKQIEKHIAFLEELDSD